MNEEAAPLVSDSAMALICGTVLMALGITIGRDVVVLSVFMWLSRE